MKVEILSGKFKGYVGYISHCGEWIVINRMGYHRDIELSTVEYIYI